MSPGPPPKDAQARRRRNRPAPGEWVDLFPLEAPVLPELPEGDWSDDTRKTWEAWRSDPVTAQYTAADEGSRRVGVSVLLRQPHGFEGLGLLLVDNQPNSLVAAKGPYPGDVVVHLQATGPATPLSTDEDQDLAALRLKKPLSFEPQIVKRLGQLTQGPVERVTPMEDTGRVDDGRGLVHLEVGGKEIGAEFSGPVERLKPGPKSIDVLLRHRPRSIPQAHASIGSSASSEMPRSLSASSLRAYAFQ
jgi:hypothetical protein